MIAALYLLIAGTLTLTALRGWSDRLSLYLATRSERLAAERARDEAEAQGIRSAYMLAEAERERVEAAWLLSQAHQVSRPKRPAYEDVVDFGQTLRG